MAQVVETTDLTKKYDGFTAVDALNLRIGEGEVFGFLGPNGAGKTTTILMLLGLTEPTSGTAQVCGYNPTREVLKVKHLVGYLPEKVGFRMITLRRRTPVMFQSYRRPKTSSHIQNFNERSDFWNHFARFYTNFKEHSSKRSGRKIDTVAL